MSHERHSHRTPSSWTRLFPVALALAVAPTGCGGAAQHPGTHANGGAAGHAANVTGENITDVLRELDEALPTPASRPLRDGVAKYEAGRGLEALNDGDLDAAIRTLRVAVEHYSPEEIARGGLPAELAPLARGIVEQVSPRGDEAHVLAAYRVLQAIAPPDPQAARRFEEIDQWGESNRREFEAPWVYRGEMAEIFKEVARIVPAPDVLQRTVDFFVQRRQAGAEAGQSRSSRRPTMEDLQQLRGASTQNTQLELALLYLRLGDFQTAADAVTRVTEGRETDLSRVLRAVANGEGGADGLSALAQQLHSADVAAQSGVCRRGRRLYPQDARFAVCLAQAAGEEGQLGLATAHLESAAQLSPQDARVLRLAIRASADWLRNELTTDDPAPGRRAYARARALMDQFAQRFPSEPRDANDLTPAVLEDLAAQLELAQANLPGAREHLERAMHLSPPARNAYFTLGEIDWRRGDGRAAIGVLQQGLALPTQPTESSSEYRPLFALQIGLAARSAGDAALATQQLTEAATAFDALARSLDGVEAAEAYLNHAIATDALGQTATVRHDLDAALNAATDNRDLAARAITFSLARGHWNDAHELAHLSRDRLQLDRTWQVYFALWSVIATRMGHFDTDHGAAEALRSIASTAETHSPWTVRLAQRYAGTLQRDQLFSYAQSAGHRAEASFYEGMLELASGDLAAAERDLRGVVATDMLRYFEYDMAWEMLARGLPSLRASSPPPGTTTSIGSPAPTTASAGAPIPTQPPMPIGAVAPHPRPAPHRVAPRHR